MLLLLCALPAGAGPAARVLTVEGRSIDAEIVAIDAQGEMTLATDGKRRTMDLQETMLVEPAAPSPATAPTPASEGPGALLWPDGFLPGAVVRAAGGAFVVDADTEIALPMQVVRAVRLMSPTDSAACESALAEALADRTAKGDVMIVLGKDGEPLKLPGALESLDADGGRFNWQGRPVPIRRQGSGRAYAIVLAKPPGEVQSPPHRIVRRDGARLFGHVRGADARQIVLDAGLAEPLAIPWPQVVSLSIRSDKLDFCSDLKPASVRMIPFVSTEWPVRFDASVTGGPITIAGEQFPKGIGVHSRTVLTYDLNKKYRLFAATIGIDDAGGDRGDVVFRVLADGQTLFDSGSVAAGQPGRAIAVEIDGKQHLTLEVDFGADLDIGDHANWANARLIK